MKQFYLIWIFKSEAKQQQQQQTWQMPRSLSSKLCLSLKKPWDTLFLCTEKWCVSKGCVFQGLTVSYNLSANVETRVLSILHPEVFYKINPFAKCPELQSKLGFKSCITIRYP